MYSHYRENVVERTLDRVLFSTIAVLDFTIDEVITPVVGFAITTVEIILGQAVKLLQFIRTLTVKEVAIASAKRIPAYAVADTLIFTVILYLLGYTITAAVVTAVAVKAILFATLFAPIGYILNQYKGKTNEDYPFLKGITAH